MSKSRFDVAIVGAGAIGSIMGAHLARAGQSLVMIARGARAAQVREQGLRIRGLANFDQPVPVLDDASKLRGAGMLIVATKAIDSAGTLDRFRTVPVDAALSIQNGVMKNAFLTEAFGAGRVVGAIANTSGALQPNGEILFTRNELIAVGEPDGGTSARTRSMAEALEHSGVRARAVPDIESLEWAKFASWSGLMLPSIAVRSTTGQFLSDPDIVPLVVKIVREIGALATRCGKRLSDQSTLPVATLCACPEEEGTLLVRNIGQAIAIGAPDHRMSSLQDLQARRPLEIEETLGYALQLADEHRLALPLVCALFPLARAIDRLNRPAT